MSMVAKTLGHHEISAPLGIGGMTEVFRAKDNRLGCEVTIKILPEELARDADRISSVKPNCSPLSITPTSPPFTVSKKPRGRTPLSLNGGRAGTG